MPAPYTLKKLTEVEDSAPRFGFAEVQEARFATDDLTRGHRRQPPPRQIGQASGVRAQARGR